MTNPTEPEVAILNEALELPTEQRAAYLDRACAGDANLRQQVEALIKEHQQAAGFMETQSAGVDLRKTILLTVPLTEKPGDRIGRYKLLQQIGEGGCGVVYMAEQEEPVRRRVALKVIKLGMDTKEVVARFEAERQALALMDHPNIAKVLDAGATETGRPYFVMELVRGIKVTDYCDQKALCTRERLELFVQICRAIQHAHQKGIIHRDIKPSNILVTVNDGSAVPKVIDFGIAKATQGRLTDKTLFTAFEQFIGTPAYMSPEQAEMTSLDIDTRSDIYSLGVLLYELLTGKTPFDPNELYQAGLDAMRRTIREKEPQKPSTRLSTMLDAERLTAAKHRQTESPKLVHLVRGDLDWIAMKCLEKDRVRRYETANGLAADVQRHLENEPVAARPPSGLYRLQKAMRRNKGAFAAGIAMALLLVFGVVTSTSQAVRASRAERKQIQLRQRAEAEETMAKTEAVKSEQTALFLEDMLKAAGPEVARGRDATLFRAILDKTADRVGKDLASQPEVQAGLWLTLGSTYAQIGDRRRAIPNLQRAVDSYRVVFPGGKTTLARALGFLGACQSYIGSVALGQTNTQSGLAMARRCGDPLTIAKCLDYAAFSILPWSLCTTQGVPYLREELALRRQLNDVTATTACMRSLACALDETDESESLFREALAMDRQSLSADDPQISKALFGLGQNLLDRHKLDEARTLLLQAAVRDRKIYEKPNPVLRIDLRILAKALIRQSKTNSLEAAAHRAAAQSPDEAQFEADLLDLVADELSYYDRQEEAETMERNALMIRKRLFGDQNLDVAQSLNFLSIVLLRQSSEVAVSVKQSKQAESERLARESLAIRRRLLGEQHLDVAASLESVGKVRQALGDLAEAESLGRQALEIRKRLVNDADGVADGMISLADTLNDERKFPEAEELYRQGLAKLKATWGEDHPWVAYAISHLATCVQRQGRLAEAELLYRQALAMSKKSFDEKHPDVVGTTSALADVLRDEGKLAEAEEQFREVLRVRSKYLGATNPATGRARDNLADILKRQGKQAEAKALIEAQSTPTSE